MIDTNILFCKEEYIRHLIRIGYNLGFDDAKNNDPNKCIEIANQLIPNENADVTITSAIKGYLWLKYGMAENKEVNEEITVSISDIATDLSRLLFN